MPAEIILQARKENEVVIEGEVHLVINENTPSDIVIEVPNQNGRLLSKEMLSNNTLVSSDTIKRPIILVPENNSIGFTGTFVLSPYEPSETYSGVPTGMRIEISSTKDFSMIMKNVVIDELLSEVPVTFEESNQVLYARVKYVRDSHVSGYSDVVKFTNSDFYVYQPKILTPTLDATGVARTPFIQVSDYQYMGNENYYAGLTYEVATDSNFTNIVETNTVGSPNTGGSGSSNGVYLNNFILNTILDEDTIYYVRVKYLGTLYPSSVWSDVISFRTFDVEEKLNIYGDIFFNKSIALDGFYYIVGGYKSGTTYYPIIIKTDNNLNIIAQKIIKTGYSNIDNFFTSIISHNGDIYVTGAVAVTSTGTKAYICKFNTSLTVLKNSYISSTDSSRYHDLVVYNNEIYVSGWYGATTRFAIVFVYNTELVIVRHKKYTATNIGFHNKILIDKNNDLLLVGYNRDASTYNRLFITKINVTTLAITLARNISTGANLVARVNSLFIDENNNYYLVGNINLIPIIIKLDTNFNLLGYKTFSNVGIFSDIYINSNLLYVTGTLDGTATITVFNESLLVIKTVKITNNATNNQSNVLNSIARLGNYNYIGLGQLQWQGLSVIFDNIDAFTNYNLNGLTVVNNVTLNETSSTLSFATPTITVADSGLVLTTTLLVTEDTNISLLTNLLL